MNPELTCLFDWIEFTIQNLKEDEVIMQVLKLNPSEFMELPKGRYGYKKQKSFGNISVLYDGMDDMGVHVILSGKGCRQYEAFHQLLELLDNIIFYEGKCTRIDLAIDDISGKIIPFDKIIEAIKKGHVVSRWKSSTELIKRNIADGKIIGQTINIGSRKSKIFMRIYDKGKEQGLEIPWIRMELEIRQERAEALQSILLFDKDVGKVCSQIINNYIRFLEPTSDSNRSRWPTSKWWLKLIDNVDKITLIRQPESRDIEDVRDWVKRQVGPSLAMIVLKDEGSIDSIIEVINSGKNRLKEKHFRILNQEKTEPFCPKGFVEV